MTSLTAAIQEADERDRDHSSACKPGQTAIPCLPRHARTRLTVGSLIYVHLEKSSADQAFFLQINKWSYYINYLLRPWEKTNTCIFFKKLQYVVHTYLMHITWYLIAWQKSIAHMQLYFKTGIGSRDRLVRAIVLHA